MGKRGSSLTARQSRRVFDRTGGRCHFCGDELVFEKRGRRHGPGSGAWEADHVFQLARSGSKDTIANLLPACAECNQVRWSRKGKDIRELLRIGLVGMEQIKGGTHLGKKLTKAVEAKDRSKEQRRRRERRKRERRRAERIAESKA